MKKFLSVGALLGSLTTIVCCFLPALFAILGFGAVFASFISAFPQLIWFSENKFWVFLCAGILLVVATAYHFRAKAAACPTDPKLREACTHAKTGASWVLVCASVLYVLGFSFAFVLPKILS